MKQDGFVRAYESAAASNYDYTGGLVSKSWLRHGHGVKVVGARPSQVYGLTAINMGVHGIIGGQATWIEAS